MRIRIDRDLDPRPPPAGVLGGEVQAVGACVDLEKTTVLPRLLDHPVDVDFITGTFQQQATGGMSQDIEIPVIHGAQDTLGLLLLVKSEAGVDGADRIVELAQEVVGIVERSIRQNVDFGGFQDTETVEAFVEPVDVFDLLP